MPSLRKIIQQLTSIIYCNKQPQKFQQVSKVIQLRGNAHNHFVIQRKSHLKRKNIIKPKIHYPFKCTQLNRNVKIGQYNNLDNFHVVHLIVETLDRFNFHSTFIQFFSVVITNFTLLQDLNTFFKRYTPKVEISQRRKTRL